MKFNSIIFAIAASFIALVFWLLIDNTYDTGDSITHYAIAHYSWKHPYLFFDNWGKPVFTILSSPFAQFGWKGITLFNSITGVVTCCLIAQIIIRLKWRISPYAALLLFFIPNFPLALNSGLTEPLYALLLTMTLYLLVIERYSLAAISISFLPFVRSEGFISITVIAFFLLAIHRWKTIPLLLTGLVCISLCGFVLQYESIFWVFKTNPYTEQVIDNYGSGNWGDFFTKFYYMTGIPFTILFWIGSFLLVKVVITRMFKALKNGFNSIEFVLLASFFAFFLAHVVFWKFGLFHSYGMSRVMISIVPVALLIVLYLFNELIILSNKNEIIYIICSLCLVIFPFTNNKSAWKFPEEFTEDPETIAIKNISKEIKIDTMKKDVVFYSSIPLMVFWDCDVYDTIRYKKLKELEKVNKADTNYLVVTEDWFMNMDNNIKKGDMVFENLQNIYSKKVSENNVVRIYINK